MYILLHDIVGISTPPPDQSQPLNRNKGRTRLCGGDGRLLEQLLDTLAPPPLEPPPALRGPAGGGRGGGQAVAGGGRAPVGPPLPVPVGVFPVLREGRRHVARRRCTRPPHGAWGPRSAPVSTGQPRKRNRREYTTGPSQPHEVRGNIPTALANRTRSEGI
eukprot:1188429-Prorocentrum_minimum.AAC.1